MKKLVVLAALVLAVIALKDRFGAAPLPEGPSYSEDQLIRTVSNGESVELFDLLDEGEWTVVQFTAPWCPGCKQLEPRLQAAIRERGTVRLRKVNIKDWDSPVARQYGIQSIPQLWLHDGTKRVSTDTLDVLRRIER